MEGHFKLTNRSNCIVEVEAVIIEIKIKEKILKEGVKGGGVKGVKYQMCR